MLWCLINFSQASILKTDHTKHNFLILLAEAKEKSIRCEVSLGRHRLSTCIHLQASCTQVFQLQAFKYIQTLKCNQFTWKSPTWYLCGSKHSLQNEIKAPIPHSVSVTHSNSRHFLIQQKSVHFLYVCTLSLYVWIFNRFSFGFVQIF